MAGRKERELIYRKEYTGKSLVLVIVQIYKHE
jgi:hypothetical protein